MKLSLVLLASAATVMASSGHEHVKRVDHAAIANRNRRNETVDLEKRQSYGGQATWYDVTTGPGACGDYMQPGDFVVALNSCQLQQFGGYQNGKPSSCYQSITIQGPNGNTAGATIMDECPTCDCGSLDMSIGLFTQFAGLDAGVFQMTWWFGGSGGGGSGGGQPTTSSQDPPPQTSTPPPQPDPTPTSTPPPAPTTTDTPTTTSTPDNTIQDVPSTSSSTTTTTSPGNNVQKMQAAALQLAGLINIAGGRA